MLKIFALPKEKINTFFFSKPKYDEYRYKKRAVITNYSLKPNLHYEKTIFLIIYL